MFNGVISGWRHVPTLCFRWISIGTGVLCWDMLCVTELLQLSHPPERSTVFLTTWHSLLNIATPHSSVLLRNLKLLNYKYLNVVNCGQNNNEVLFVLSMKRDTHDTEWFIWPVDEIICYQEVRTSHYWINKGNLEWHSSSYDICHSLLCLF